MGKFNKGNEGTYLRKPSEERGIESKHVSREGRDKSPH